jgi:hypothetical protein
MKRRYFKKCCAVPTLVPTRLSFCCVAKCAQSFSWQVDSPQMRQYSTPLLLNGFSFENIIDVVSHLTYIYRK